MCDQHPIQSPTDLKCFFEGKKTLKEKALGIIISKILRHKRFYKYSSLNLIKKLIFLFPEKENIKFDVNTIVTIISLLIIHTPTVYITVLGHIPHTPNKNLGTKILTIKLKSFISKSKYILRQFLILVRVAYHTNNDLSIYFLLHEKEKKIFNSF